VGDPWLGMWEAAGQCIEIGPRETPLAAPRECAKSNAAYGGCWVARSTHRDRGARCITSGAARAGEHAFETMLNVRSRSLVPWSVMQMSILRRSSLRGPREMSPSFSRPSRRPVMVARLTPERSARSAGLEAPPCARSVHAPRRGHGGPFQIRKRNADAFAHQSSRKHRNQARGVVSAPR